METVVEEELKIYSGSLVFCIVSKADLLTRPCLYGNRPEVRMYARISQNTEIEFQESTEIPT